MTWWPELVSTALIGTDRRPVPTPPDGPLAMPARGAAPADRLLELAAAAALARRAGQPAQSGVALPQPAPDETLAAVPPPAAARLNRLLREAPRGQQGLQQRVTLITEWLSVAVSHQLRAPGGLLPALLEEARSREQWRPLVAAVGGARARWLAAQQPAWSWLLDLSIPLGAGARRASGSGTTVDDEPLSDQTPWYEGTPAQRLSYLVSLRDADPDRATALLTEAWPDESPPARVAFLSTMEAKLSLADEALCEQALDDRRKEVRVVAARLLAGLAGSAYHRRMTARGQSYVRAHPSGELVVRPPAECDREMRRDGIEPRPPQGIGERAWWVEQVLARTPLSAWSGLGSDPATVLGHPVADDWAAILHRGWAQATVDQRDPDWAAAFVASSSPAMTRQPPPAAALAQAVYRQLGPTDAVAVAVRMLADEDPFVEFVLPGCPRPWPDHLVDAAITRMRESRRGAALKLSHLVTLCAFGFPPSTAPAAVELARRYRAEHGDDDAHAPFYDRLADTLTLRRQMHQEFE